jgi:hypothetical protein
MGRFDSMFGDDTELNFDEAAASASITGSVGGGATTLSLKESNYTESTYEVYHMRCQKEGCDEIILNFINPTYDLKVGLADGIPMEMSFSEYEGEEASTTTMLNDGIPMEISFSEYEGEVQDGEVTPWSNHALVDGKIWVCTCKQCNTENRYAVTATGAFVTEHDANDSDMVPIPKNRVQYVHNAKPTWKSEASEKSDD